MDAPVTLGRLLVVIGLVVAAAGLLLLAAGKVGLGRLPGDIAIERDNVSLYFPLATSLLISVVLTLLLSLFYWMRARA
jgi:hypothetical protein